MSNQGGVSRSLPVRRPVLSNRGRDPRNDLWVSNLRELTSEQNQFAKLLAMVSQEDPSVNKLFKKLGDWDFPLFEFAVATEGYPLCVITIEVLRRLCGWSDLNISLNKLLSFLWDVERTYRRNNFFHTSLHAADVVQAAYCLIAPLKGNTLSRLSNAEIFGFMIAIACHDVGHPMMNNPFHTSMKTPFAKGKDAGSVLEDYHLEVTRNEIEGCGLLDELSAQEVEKFWYVVSAVVEATDLSRHGSILSRVTDSKRPEERRVNNTYFLLDFCQVVIKCADIANPSRPWPIALSWASMVCEEFFHQGSVESTIGARRSPNTNREETDIPKFQAGFLKIFLLPTLEAFTHAFSPECVVLKLAQQNISRWECISEKSKAGMGVDDILQGKAGFWFAKDEVTEMSSEYISKIRLDVKDAVENNLRIARTYWPPLQKGPLWILKSLFFGSYEFSSVLQRTDRHIVLSGLHVQHGDIVIKIWSTYSGKPNVGQGIMLSNSSRMTSQHEFMMMSELCTKEHQAKGLFVPKPLDILDDGGDAAIVMSKCPGIALRDLVSCNHVLPLETVVNITAAITKAILVLHTNGIVHLDLSPGNVLWDEERGIATLIDLELATRLVQANTILGQEERFGVFGGEDNTGGACTIDWASPEQLLSSTGRSNVGMHTDIYSIGALMYMLLTSESPQKGSSPADTARNIRFRAPPDPCSRRWEGYVPHALCEIVLKLLSKEPRQRYFSAAALLYDLNKVSSLMSSGSGLSTFKIAERNISEVFHISPKLYQRDDDINRVMSSLNQAAQRSVLRPSTVMIEGEKGFGKSSFISQLRGPLCEGSMPVITIRGESSQVHIPYSGIGNMMNEVIKVCLTRVNAKSQRAMISSVRSHLGSSLTAMLKFVTSLGNLLQIEPPPSLSVDGEIGLGFSQVNKIVDTGFKNLVKAIALTEPFIVIVDDMHIMDAQSLQVLDMIMSDLQGGGIFLVAVYCANDAACSSTLKGMHDIGENSLALFMKKGCLSSSGAGKDEESILEHVVLKPLTTAAIELMLSDSFQTAMHPSLQLDKVASLLLQQTRGNPSILKSHIETLALEHILVLCPDSLQWKVDMESLKTSGVPSSQILEVVEIFAKKVQCANMLDILQVVALMDGYATVDLISSVLHEEMLSVEKAILEAKAAGFTSHVFDQAGQEVVVIARSRLLNELITNINDEKRGSLQWKGATYACTHIKSLCSSVSVTICNILNDSTPWARANGVLTAELRRLIIDVNVIAGRFISNSGSWALALSYFRTAHSMVTPEDWTTEKWPASPSDGALCGTSQVELLQCKLIIAENMVGSPIDVIKNLYNEGAKYLQSDTFALATMAIPYLWVLVGSNEIATGVEVARGFLKRIGIEVPFEPSMTCVKFYLYSARFALARLGSWDDIHKMLSMRDAKTGKRRWIGGNEISLVLDVIGHAMTSADKIGLRIRYIFCAIIVQKCCIHGWHHFLPQALSGLASWLANNGGEVTYFRNSVALMDNILQPDDHEVAYSYFYLGRFAMNGAFGDEPLSKMCATFSRHLKRAWVSGEVIYSGYLCANILLCSCFVRYVYEGTLEYTKKKSTYFDGSSPESLDGVKRHYVHMLEAEEYAMTEIKWCHSPIAKHVYSTFVDPQKWTIESCSELSSDEFDRIALEKTLKQRNAHLILLWINCMRMFLSYLYGDYKGSLRCSDAIFERGIWLGLLFHQYYCLAGAMVYSTLPPDRRNRVAVMMARSVQELRFLQKGATFHRMRFLVAKGVYCYSVKGNKDRGFECLKEAALECEKGNGNHLDLAIIFEILSEWSKSEKNILDRQRHIAYREATITHYTKYGMIGKAKQLKNRMARVAIDRVDVLDRASKPARSRSFNETHTHTTTTSSDYLSDEVDHFSKAMTELQYAETVENLYPGILKYAVESSGGAGGVLILGKSDESSALKKFSDSVTGENNLDFENYCVVASSLEANVNCIGMSLDDTALSSLMPCGIMKYALRFGIPLMEDKPLTSSSSVISGDKYISQRRPQSLLCLPLRLRKDIIGVVYVEKMESSNPLCKSSTMLDTFLESAMAAIDSFALRNKIEHQSMSMQRFVSNKVVEWLGCGSIERCVRGVAREYQMTLLMADIRDFTTLTENMSSEKTFSLINAYLDDMEPIVRSHGGTVDQFIGDGVLALFSEADGAVDAAIDMCRVASTLHERKPTSFHQRIRIGVGVHTGHVMIGAVGSVERIATTVMGDTVNTVARLEGISKLYGADILISGETRANLRNEAAFPIRKLDVVTPKGKSRTISIFEVFHSPEDLAAKAKLAAVEKLEQAKSLYLQGKFTEAVIAFEEYSEEARGHDMRVAEVFSDRCRSLKAKLGTGNRLHSEGWDGVWRLDTK